MSEEDSTIDLRTWFNGLNETTQHVLINKTKADDNTEFIGLVEMMLKSKSYDKEQIPPFFTFVKSLQSLAPDGDDNNNNNNNNSDKLDDEKATEEQEEEEETEQPKNSSDKKPVNDKKKTTTTTTTATKGKTTDKKTTTTTTKDNNKLADKKTTTNANRSKSQGAVPPAKTPSKSPKGGAVKSNATKTTAAKTNATKTKTPAPTKSATKGKVAVTVTPASPRDENDTTDARGRSKTKSDDKEDTNAKKDKTPEATETIEATESTEPTETNGTESTNQTDGTLTTETPSGPSKTHQKGATSVGAKKKEKESKEKEKLGVKDTGDKRASSWSPAPWYKQNFTNGLNDFWEEKEASHMRGKWHDDLDRLKSAPKAPAQPIRFNPVPNKNKYLGVQRAYHGRNRKRARKNVQPKKKPEKFRALNRVADYSGGEGGKNQRPEGTGGLGGKDNVNSSSTGGGDGMNGDGSDRFKNGDGGDGGLNGKNGTGGDDGNLLKPGTGGDDGEDKKLSKKAEFKKKLIISEAVRAAERNEDAIAVNLDNMRNKPDYDKMVTYNMNWLANLANNPFNVDYIIEEGAIDTIAEIMKHHKNNPAIMKDVARLLNNIAKSKPEYADLIAHSSIIDECLAALRDHPNECGIYALDILDSVLDHCTEPVKLVETLVDKNALPILFDALDEFGEENTELAAAATRHLNKESKWKPDTMDWMGDNELFFPIMRAMRAHPENEELAFHGCEILPDIAVRDNKYRQAMKDNDVVPIICGVMSETPESERLKEAGVKALKVFADPDDLLDALKVVFNFDQFENPVLIEALSIVGNLALIPENADFIAEKGGINALLNCIAAKDQLADPTPEDLDVIAKATRALGRLLDNEKNAQEFGDVKGIDHLRHLVDKYSDDEPILNAVMEALEYLAKTPVGQEQILDSGILIPVTEVLAENPEYNTMFRKYARLMGYMPLDNRDFLGGLIDAGMLECIKDNLNQHNDNPADVVAASDLICDLATLHPDLSAQLAEDDAPGLISGMRTHQNDPETMKHIFDAIEALIAGNPELREVFEQKGMDAELDRILKNENTSIPMKDMIQEFLERLNALKAKPEEEPEEDPRDKVLRELKELYDQLDDPEFARQFIEDGKVVGVLDNIQDYYDDAEIVQWGLKDLAKIARVPGGFHAIEEAGMAEAVVQCMLEHPDKVDVQLEGFKVFSGLANQDDPNVPDTLMQPITLDTLLKGVEDNINSADFVGEFCDIIEGLVTSNPNDAYNVANALQGEGVIEVLQEALDVHTQKTPDLVPKIEETLGHLKQILQPVDPKMDVNMDLEPYGTGVLTMAQLANMDEDELLKLMSAWDTDQLMQTMREAKDPVLVQWSVNEVNRRLNGGDQEVHSAMVNGGVNDLLNQANANFDNGGPLGAALDTLGTLANEDRLKPMLGMIGLIPLILETMRAHPHDIELLDRCCYLLSLLTYNNEDNINQVIELGGVADIINVTKRHNVVNFLCESALLVLVNLCHRSDKNKVLICRSGGAKTSIDCLRQYNHCRTPEDQGVVVAAFRCLANFGYVEDNLKQLVKLNTVHLIMETMQKNTDQSHLIQMGVVALANLSSHERAVRILVTLGVMDLAINVSSGYPDEIEIQKSCLGCMGNLLSEPANAVLFMDKKGYERIYAIMQELLFEEPVVVLCLKLLKILATTPDIAKQLCHSGGCQAVAQLMTDNMTNLNIVTLGCQALCRMIVTKETAKEMYSQGVIDLMIQISTENNNWSNLELYNEVMKVVVNLTSAEENAQAYAHKAAVPLLKAIEMHKEIMFLQNAATALSSMSLYPVASRYLVKRGAVAVILKSAVDNKDRKNLLARYLRTISNLLYTESRTGDECIKTNAYSILEELAQEDKDDKAIQKEWQEFVKAYRLKTQKNNPLIGANHYSAPISDRLDRAYLRLLTGGAIVTKHKGRGTNPHKKIIRVDDTCTKLLLQNPNDTKKQGDEKQIPMTAVRAIKPGNDHSWLKGVPPDRCFQIIGTDPNNKDFYVCLETTTQEVCQRWVEALQEFMAVVQSHEKRNNE